MYCYKTWSQLMTVLYITLVSAATSSSSRNQSSRNNNIEHLQPDGKDSAIYSVMDYLINKFTKIKPTDVTFYLYTSKDKKSGTMFTKDTLNELIEKADPDLMTKIISHGWYGSHEVVSVQLLKDTYLKHHNYNIILVNWRRISCSYNYCIPARLVHRIGRMVSDMINILLKLGFKANLIHLIGFSLGAHVVAEAGNFLVEKVYRVTILDAAAPVVSNHSKFPTSGRFVDVIHTGAPVAAIHEPIGTVDFYVNGGIVPQADCSITDVVTQVCSHEYAWLIFSETIKDYKRFPGKKCKNRLLAAIGEKLCTGDVEYMGENASLTAKGIYYVKAKGLTIPKTLHHRAN